MGWSIFRERKITFSKAFETLKGDLELILICGFGRVVENVNSEKRDDRHGRKFSGVELNGECDGATSRMYL